MFIYIKKQHRNESKLPLDLRTPPVRVPFFTFDNFRYAEKMFVQQSLVYRAFRKLRYVKDDLYDGFANYKRKQFKRLKVGSLVAIIITSKTGIISSFPQASPKKLRQISRDSGDSSIIRTKFRGFFGHCLKKKNCKSSSYLLLRTTLLGCIFCYKINVFAPNLINLFIIPKLWKKKNKKKLRIFKVFSKKTYSSSIFFKLEKIRAKKRLKLLKTQRR